MSEPKKSDSLTAPGYERMVRDTCEALDRLGYYTDAEAGRALVAVAVSALSTDSARRTALSALLGWFGDALRLVQAGGRPATPPGGR